MQVSVVIPTYNRKYVLEKCLEALFNQNYAKHKYEIILIDDGSTDGTEKMIKLLSSSCQLRYIRNEKRLGQSISRNKGVKIAEGRYIIFVDSDIIVVPEFVQEHLNSHKQQEDVIVNGELIYISTLHEVGRRKKSFRDISFSPFDTANVSVKRECINKVGGFDEGLLPYGWQDIELGYRLKKMGLKRKKNKKALGYHFRGGEDTFNVDFLKEKELMRGMSGALYFKKHPSFDVKLAVRGNPLFTFAFIGRWLDESSKGKRFFSRLRKKNIKWLNAALIKLILCHHYLKGYEQQVKK